jgi:hypothetical protein
MTFLGNGNWANILFGIYCPAQIKLRSIQAGIAKAGIASSIGRLLNSTRARSELATTRIRGQPYSAPLSFPDYILGCNASRHRHEVDKWLKPQFSGSKLEVGALVGRTLGQPDTTLLGESRR